MKRKTENIYIYFLDLSQKSKKVFFSLAATSSLYGITLIPVSLRELRNLASSDLQYVMVLNNDLKSYKSFMRIYRKELKFYLKNIRFYLFDLSSFAPIDETVPLNRKIVYQHIPLPIRKSEIFEFINYTMNEEKKRRELWPGGKRGAIPIKASKQA